MLYQSRVRVIVRLNPPSSLSNLVIRTNLTSYLTSSAMNQRSNPVSISKGRVLLTQRMLYQTFAIPLNLKFNLLSSAMHHLSWWWSYSQFIECSVLKWGIWINLKSKLPSFHFDGSYCCWMALELLAAKSATGSIVAATDEFEETEIMEWLQESLSWVR